MNGDVIAIGNLPTSLVMNMLHYYSYSNEYELESIYLNKKSK